MEILSEVEPTLKWATNKKLHLELAVIRAVQSLAEVGFDQVLDALEELQQGPTNPRPTGKSETAPLVIHPARTLGTPGAPGTPASPTKPTEFQTSDAKSENVNVEHEHVPGKHAAIAEEKIIIEPAQTPEPPVFEPETAGTSSGSSETKTDETNEQGLIPTATAPDLNQLWIEIVTEVRKNRPLIQQYFTAAVPLSLLHNELRLGFGSQHSMAMETLLRPNNRKYIEQLLSERLGKPTSIRGETRDDLAPIVFPDKTEPATNADDDFRKDPLIQKALEIFQAEIQAAD
jgi:DNA polymerase III subunit gamma/tau